MSNPNKAKGTAWETALVDSFLHFLGGKRFGLGPYRPAQRGRGDVGDVNGVSPFVLQAKDDRSFSLSAWLDGPKGVTVQARNAGEQYGAVVVKRARKAIGAAYAILRYEDLVRVVVRLRRAEYLLEAHAPEAFQRHADETAAELARPFPRLSDLGD